MFLSQKFCRQTFVFIALTTIILSGCAKQTKVVLLPDPSGTVGKLTVTSDAGSVDITKALEATTIKGRQSAPSTPVILSERDVQKEFSEALQSLPDQPVHFILYFMRDSNNLTEASANLIPEVLETIHKRESENISVIGHTDTAGNPEYNLRLSTLRAQAIADILKEKGVKSSNIKATSHGENNPLIPTKDNVNEPKNRRVEIVVR
jgi:outer membrane protein OmpA-like peptidoglycan-associated protein